MQGLEPWASCSQSRRATNCATPRYEVGRFGWAYSPKTLKNKLLTQKNRLKGGSSEKGGPSDRIRTCGILLPNLSGILFPLVYSGFQQFPICFTYSLTLLSPLFPGVPALSVVIYVVKNASRPVSGECSPMPSGKRFSLLLAAL